MAIMGLRINGGGGGGVNANLANIFSKAMFGDPEREMKMAKLRSDLATDEYQRRQYEEYTRLLADKAAHQEWQTRAAQGGVPGATKFVYDAMNAGRGGGVASADQPVPVEADPSAILAMPQDRPPSISSTFPARPELPVPVEELEPDLRMSTYPLASDFNLPETAPQPLRRPGDMPPMPGMLEGMPPDLNLPPAPSLLEGVPADLRDLLGRRELMKAPPDLNLPGMPAPVEGLPPELTSGYQSWSRPDEPLEDLSSLFSGGGVPPLNPLDLPPEPAPAPPIAAAQAPVPVEPEPMPPLPQVGPSPPRPDVGMGYDLPAPIDLPGLGTDLPDTSVLSSVPPDLRSSQGTVTNVPGRLVPGPGRPTPPAPLETRLPNEPALALDSAPPLPVTATGELTAGLPITATGEITDPNHPKAPVVAIQTNQGPLPLSREEVAGMVEMTIANGGDVAGALNKMAGGVGMVYGNLDNPTRMRIAAQLATGNLATTTTVVSPGDYAGVDAATRQQIAVDKASPGKLKEGVISDKYGDREVYKDAQGNTKIRWIPGGTKGEANIQVVDNIPYQVTTDAQGTAHLKIADGFTAPEAPPFDESTHEGVLLNIMTLWNRKKNEGIPTTPAEDMAYNVAYAEKFGPKTSTVRLPNGMQDTQTQFFDPPADFRVPATAPGATAAPATAAPAATAPAPTTATGAAAAAANPPALAGQPLMVKNRFGERVPVKNYGGWTSPGEKPPSETTIIQTPTGKVQHTISGDEKERNVTGESSKIYTTAYEAIDAMRILNQYGPGGKNPPSGMQRLLTDWQSSGLTSDILDSLVNQDEREYGRAVLTFINASKRRESGAAVSEKEVQDYIRRYSMTPGSNNRREYFSARNARNKGMMAVRLELSTLMRPSQLQAFDEEMARSGVDFSEELPEVGTRPQTAPKATTVDENGKIVPYEGD